MAKKAMTQVSKSKGQAKKKVPVLLYIIPSAILLTAVITAIVVQVAHSTSKNTPQGLLEKYFRAKYTQNGGGLDKVLECVNPFLRDNYAIQVKAGGKQNAEVEAEWLEEAKKFVGGNVKVSVQILDSYTQDETTVTYRVTMTGSDGKQTFLGSAPLMQRENRWYLSSYFASIVLEE